ncbi:MAG: ATP-binding cassette domain-containing protein [Flavobacteriales bacterium]|nr:ATP-binding cassette domain-containing protein [Flavobacteriales bacterium]
MSILLKNISKNYGAQKALNEVTLTIEKGQITGLLGPNGAGKSTLMKIITGAILPTSGTAVVNGVDVVASPLQVQQSLGYLPEHNPQYLELYVREYLEYVAQLYKVDKKRIPTVIEQTVLGPEQHKKIGSLSKGYRQRVGLAAALIPDPEVLILDEPTTGLDPAQLIEIRALLKNIATDKTVLFSTHIMQEVVELCDTVVFLQAGEIKQQCNRAEIEQGSAHLERLFSA